MTTLTEIYSNLSITTLASGISPSAVSLTVAAGTGAIFPAPTAGQFFRFTNNDALTGLVYETIYATGRTGDTFTGLLRGQENTTPVAWVSGDKVYTAPTGGAMANLTQIYELQSNAYQFSADSGAANAYAIAPIPANMQTPVPGAVLYFQAAHVNTGASTITVNGSSAYPLVGSGRTALQGGEVSGFCAVTYDTALAAYVLLWGTGGTVQIAAALASNQAISLGQANTLYAALNGNASIPFSASVLNTGVVTSGSSATTPLLLESNDYVAAVTNGNTAYQQMYVANPVSTQAAVNLGYANTTYAKIAGSATQVFAASVLQTPIVQAPASTALLLESDVYVAAVNRANTAYVPFYCANPTSPQAAVNLQYAQLAFANLNGTYSQSFQVANLYLNGGWIAQNNGGGLVIEANGGVFIANLGDSAFVPLYCAAGGGGNQALVYGQMQSPIVASAQQNAGNTTVNIGVSFTAPGPGALFAVGNINYSQINGSSNSSTLYINGAALASDNTVLTRAHVAAAYTGGGGCSANYIAAASPQFTAWLTLLFVPLI